MQPLPGAAAAHQDHLLEETVTIEMPDSITPGKIPMTLARRAVLGYADGEWPTADRLHELFPGAEVVSLTVLCGTLKADGVDCEPGNVNAKRAAAWVRDKLAAEPGCRPIVYADLASEGYSMSEVLAELANLGVSRKKIRILSAHYGQEHICSAPNGCRDAKGSLITWTADGTQWTDEFPGIGGTIDMSLLNDDFFGAPASGDHISVWQLEVSHPADNPVHGAVVTWQHTGGVSSWLVTITGPHFADVAHEVSKPQAVFAGLAAASEYTVHVTSIVGGKLAGVTGIKAFRTTAA
jgi:hypothetical protein